MKTELDKNKTIEKDAAINLPAGSLWRDLRAEAGHGCGIEWLLLYEDDPLTLKPSSRLSLCKSDYPNIRRARSGRKRAI